MTAKTCAQCGASWKSASEPPSNRSWCSQLCSEMWFAADPARREGWISVADITPEQLSDGLRAVGLAVDGAKQRAPS